jgi:phosphonate dehydrogenase
MMPKTVITNWVHPEVVEYLEGKCTVVANGDRTPWTRAEILERAGDATALMTFMPDRVDAAFLDQCPQLNIIACALKGADNFDGAACTRHGVWLTIVPDLLTVPTAELAIGLLIGLARHIPEGDRFLRSGKFNGWRPLLYGSGLEGSTVGLIGGGSVGAAIAERLKGFGCTLLYDDIKRLSPERERALALRRVPLAELVGQCDFIISACPLTEQTKHLIGPKLLALFKPGSVLINISRGSVVDENAVAEALEGGGLAGYAADVFEMEDWPRSDRPRAVPERLLAHSEKTLFTPHLGSAVDRVRREITLEAAKSIVQCLDGLKPDGAVNQVVAAS